VSFDVFLSVFDHGDLSGIPLSTVRECFGRHVEVAEGAYWKLRYDAENSCNVDLSIDPADPNRVQGLAINRPCGDSRFWNAIFKLLQAGNIVVYFPGGAAPLVASEGVKAHMPPDMVESLGNPIIVDSGAAILARIRAS
jgi:hypothetical protein